MRIEWIEASVLAAGAMPAGRSDLDNLHDEGIRALVTLTEQPITSQREITLERLGRYDIIPYHFPIKDQHPPTADVRAVVSFIDRMKNEGRPVYLHCYAGVGRTGTLLHAYYLLNGLSLEEAKAKVKAAKLTSQFFLLSPTQQAYLVRLADELVPPPAP